MTCHNHRDWTEMPRMCALIAHGAKGDPVYVNPMTVRYVRPGATGNSLITFDDNQTLGVAVPIDQVIAALDNAMK